MKSLAKRAAGAIGALGLVTVGMLATAAPANAGLQHCSSGALCAYLGENGAGDPGEVFGNNANLHQYNKFDNAESLYNNGNSCNVRVYSKINYAGTSRTIPMGYVMYSLSGTGLWHSVGSNTWCV
jgi:hypothetical protein